MNRTDLAKHIRSRLDPLAEDLADLLWDRIEEQVAQVLEVSKSALLSELDRPPQNAEAATLANDGLGTPCTVGTRAGNTVAPPYDSTTPLELDRDAFLGTTNVGSAPRIFPAARPAKVAVTAQDSVRTHVPERREAPENIPAPPPPALVTTKGKPRERSVMKCRKCGAVGYRSDGCGRTHNIGESDDDEAEVDAPTAPAPVPFIAKRDRFAAIEQSAAKRTGALPIPRASFEMGPNRT